MSWKLLLKVTGCIVVAEDGASDHGRRVGEVAFTAGLTQRTRLRIALLTKARLLWT
jgi:hypothetical protein